MRPKDPRTGRPISPPSKRLSEAPRLIQAAVFAATEDRRFAFMPLMKKQQLAIRAIDHVVDGDAAPKHVFQADAGNPTSKPVAELWLAMVRIVRERRSGDRGLGAEP